MSDTVETPRADKTVCVVRYGGFGDQIMASNILPELKRQGYHVTFNTTPKGKSILEHDPHVDAWIVQDEDEVPNEQLGEHWKAMAAKFDRFINLSESVEGTLLAVPGRVNHGWPVNLRRKYLNKNYLEWTSELAEVPYHSEAKFYPSPEEKAKVAAYIASVRAARLPADAPLGLITPPVFSILWVLSGSSQHKFYPWQDSVIAKVLLEMPEADVIFNGDYACQILEAGWESEPRVHCESGNMGIRESLALAQAVDCVVGPETGVLNAVGFEPNAKVILLSHSSAENLTKHWANTATVEPQHTECYPCHRLHYTREFCHEHEATGAAMCQINITPDRVYEAIRAAYLKWKDPTL